MNSWSVVSGILAQRSSVAYLLGQFTDNVTTLLIDYHLSQRKFNLIILYKVHFSTGHLVSVNIIKKPYIIIHIIVFPFTKFVMDAIGWSDTQSFVDKS